MAVSERPLALVLGNLVGNAASHGEPGGKLDWSIERHDEQVVLDLSNPLAGEVDSKAVLEPFFTTGRAGEHSGLGLGIVRALCEASGIHFDLVTANLRFRVRLTLPRLPTAS